MSDGTEGSPGCVRVNYDYGGNPKGFDDTGTFVACGYTEMVGIVSESVNFTGIPGFMLSPGWLDGREFENACLFTCVSPID